MLVRFDDESYSLERRTIGIVAESTEIEIRLTPQLVCVNPVFEIAGGSPQLKSITLDDQPLQASDWRWDGQRLWLNVCG